MNLTIRKVVLAVGLGSLGAAGTGCELLVQLDRGLVAPDDGGCPICPPLLEEGDDDGSAKAEPVDTEADAAFQDAGADGAIAHTGGDAGG